MTRILIADDNAQNLYLLETVMKSSGYEVTSTSNGVEALTSAQRNPPDIIVTDILMPEMDGFELCRHWKADKLLQRIPFVFYTATYTDLKDEQFALSLGAERFVIKPQEPEVLLQIVQEVLSASDKTRKASRKKAQDEKRVLQQYNEVLFHKLEQKVLKLEDSIAKQKIIENELRESEQKYRTLITSSPDGIFIVNLKGNFLSVNRAMCERLKYTEEELLSMSIWDIVPEQYVDIHKKRIDEIVIGKTHNVAVEYTVRGKDGTLNYVEILSAPYYEGKQLIGFQGIARDIGERKQAAEKLEKSLEKLKKTLSDAINTLAKIVEMRDPYTAGHQRKVADLAIAIAREMNCDGAQVENLGMAALIHDIGKIHVPTEILSKPGKLSKGEFDLIKTHAASGYEIVKNMEFPPAVAEAVLQHHERLDGSGYPNGLKGSEICFEARILSVSDVVEAMSSHRPYRPALGVTKALEEISSNKGRLYDPAVVDACLKLFTEKDFKFSE